MLFLCHRSMVSHFENWCIALVSVGALPKGVVKDWMCPVVLISPYWQQSFCLRSVIGNVKSSRSQKTGFFLPDGLGTPSLIGEILSGGAEAFSFHLPLPLSLTPFFADCLLPIGQELRLIWCYHNPILSYFLSPKLLYFSQWLTVINLVFCSCLVRLHRSFAEVKEISKAWHWHKCQFLMTKHDGVTYACSPLLFFWALPIVGIKSVTSEDG